MLFSSALRAACAATGLLLLACAGAQILSGGGQRIDLLPIVSGLLFLVPVVFGGGPAHWRDITRIEEDTRRLRLASAACFTFAIAMYALVVALHGRGVLAQNAESLGAAFWVVALLMLFLFVFFTSRRRALVRRNSAD